MNRTRNTTRSGGAFASSTVSAVWQKATAIPGYPGFARDACGAIIQYSEYGKLTRYGWEIDHIRPVAQQGSDLMVNLQPLHHENNRYKSDMYPSTKYCVVSQ